MIIFNEKSGLLLLSLIALGATACRSAQHSDQTPVPIDRGRLCPVPIIGAKLVLVPGSLLLLGEVHGTKEIPRFVAGLVCEASQGVSGVQLGLEIPCEEQLRFDSFLSSAGTARDRDTLLEGKFWRQQPKDGRSSGAMVELLESLRRLKALGARINVFLFDQNTHVQDRDAEMAKKILVARARTPDDVIVILTGNLHAKKAKVKIGTTELVPMGFDLVDGEVPVMSLDCAYPPGTAWMCRGRGSWSEICHSHPMGGKREGEAPFIKLSGGVGQGYDGIFYVPSLTASRPVFSSQ